MNGEWVTVRLGEDVECRVLVLCIPNTPYEVLQRIALNMLKSRIPEKKEEIFGLSDSLQIISDYEYSQGIGSRYKTEQKLKEIYEQIK